MHAIAASYGVILDEAARWDMLSGDGIRPWDSATSTDGDGVPLRSWPVVEVRLLTASRVSPRMRRVWGRFGVCWRGREGMWDVGEQPDQAQR